MIAFRLQNGFLELSPSVQVSLTATNPYLDVDHIGRSYTFDFNVENTPQNDKVFKHLYRLDGIAETQDLPCTCFLNGIEFQAGVISVQEILGGYKCYFQSDNRLAIDDLDKNLSYFVSDTLTLFTDGPTNVSLDWVIFFVPDAIYENQTVQVRVRGQLFTLTIYNNSFDFDYASAASDLTNQINAAFATIAAEVFNDITVKLHSTDGSLILIEPIEHCFSQQAFEQSLYEHQRIVAGIQALINNANAPVAFPPVYAPSVYTDNSKFQQFKVLNNLESPANYALSWVIWFVPDAIYENQTVQVKVRGQLFTITIYNNSFDFNYAGAAETLRMQLTIAFPDLNISVYNDETVKIESVEGINVIIEPVLHCETAALNSYPNNYGKLKQNVIENSKIWSNSVIPMLKISYIFKKIAEKLGFLIGGEVWTEADFQKLVFFNTVTLDEGISLHSDTQFINRWKKEIVLASHIPDMSAKDFLNYFSQQFGVYYDIENGTFLIRWKQLLYEKLPQNWSTLHVVSDIRRVPYRKKGLKIKYEHDKEAPTSEYPSTFAPYIIGDGGQEYVLPFDTPTIIELNQQGYSRIIHWWGKTDVTPKMLVILRGGLFGNSNTLVYQFATNDDKNYKGFSIQNAWTLAIQGDNGLYQKRLKNIVKYIEADDIRAEYRLNINHILQLQKGELTRAFTHTFHGGFEGMIEQINLKIQNKTINIATVDFKKI